MDQLTGALEENILCALVWNTDLAMEILLKVELKLFSSRNYQIIAKASYQHLERYKQAPAAHLPDILERELANKDSGEFLARIVSRMQELEPLLQADYVRDSMNEWIEARELINAISDAADLAHHGKLDEAREALSGARSAGASQPGIWLHEPQNFLRFMTKTEDEDLFSSGVELLDTRGVRPKRKGLMLMIAPAKAGKSWFLINLGKAALLRRQKVLHITLEMSEDEVAQRYIMALFSMSEKQTSPVITEMFLKSADGDFEGFDPKEFLPQSLLTTERASLVNQLRNSKFAGSKQSPRLLVKEFPTGTLTTRALGNYLEILKQKDGWEPDILILDYVNLMAVDAKNIRVDTGRVYREVRGIAMARNIACVSATQSNREGSTARAVKAEHVSEDWSAVGTADTIMTLSKTDEEKERNLARIGVVAARHAPDGWIAYITQLYQIGQFCIDSVYYGNSLKQIGGSEDENKPRRRRERR